MLNAQQEIYKNSFEATPLTLHQYSGNPVAHSNITSSVWTNDGENLSFSQESGVVGNALGLSINGGSKYFLTLDIEPGETISLTGLDFWGQRTSANMAWELYVDNTMVSSGNTTTTGNYIGPVTFTTPINDLAGTVTVELDLNGNGNGTYILDDFVLYGTASDNCEEYIFFPASNVACEGKTSALPVVSTMPSYPFPTYQWKILNGSTYVDLSNGSLYQNVTQSTLVILNTPLSLDGEKYLLEITSPEGCVYTAGPITLNVYPKPQPITIQYNN